MSCWSVHSRADWGDIQDAEIREEKRLAIADTGLGKSARMASEACQVKDFK